MRLAWTLCGTNQKAADLDKRQRTRMEGVRMKASTRFIALGPLAGMVVLFLLSPCSARADKTHHQVRRANHDARRALDQRQRRNDVESPHGRASRARHCTHRPWHRCGFAQHHHQVVVIGAIVVSEAVNDD